MPLRHSLARAKTQSRAYSMLVAPAPNAKIALLETGTLLALRLKNMGIRLRKAGQGPKGDRCPDQRWVVANPSALAVVHDYLFYRKAYSGAGVFFWSVSSPECLAPRPGFGSAATPSCLPSRRRGFGRLGITTGFGVGVPPRSAGKAAAVSVLNDGVISPVCVANSRLSISP